MGTDRMTKLRTILGFPRPRPNMATYRESAFQPDVRRGKHPKSVHVWDRFNEAVRSHRDSKTPTKRRFLSDRGPDPVCLSSVLLPLSSCHEKQTLLLSSMTP